jgi:hypothetical protein
VNCGAGDAVVPERFACATSCATSTRILNWRSSPLQAAVSVMTGAGNGVGGVAASPVRYAAPVGAHGLAMGDVKRRPCGCAACLKDTANLVYYLGNGDGTFAPLAGGTYPGISGQPQYVAVGEFDAAGQSSLDVVIARVAQDPIYLHNRPNLPPVANAGADQTVTASVATGAFVTLDGSASTDPESTALTFEWRDAANTVVGNAAVSGVTVPLGVHVYTLRVTDAGGAVATDTVTITTLAGTTTSIACSTPVTYTGAAITPCTATVLGVDGFSLGGAPSYTDNMAVGTATASYTFAGDAAHASSFGSTTFSISAKPVTATLTAIDKVYDGTATEPDANMSCTVTGTVPGDVVTCAASNGVFSGANAGSSAVSATVTLGGAHAGNYTLGAVGTSLQSTTLTATSGGSVASTTADLVYGQLGSFTVRLQNNGGVSANSMNQPYRVAIDSTGGLYVAEEQNHRVVYFSAGSTTATRVYGQSGSFTSATSNNGGLSANSLSYARGVAVDANDNLYIVDGGNHRVLFYPAGTTTATRVYGQGGVFTTGTINKGGVSADSLNDPTIAVADASGNVYIADQNNNRVLFYAGTSTTATRVYGQNGNFATTGTGVSATTFNQPGNLVVDAAGNLYVSDLTNNRVLFFLNGSTTATRVYGQNGNFGTNSAGTSATALRFPRAAAIDSNNNLYVADPESPRALLSGRHDHGHARLRPGRQLHERHVEQRRRQREQPEQSARWRDQRGRQALHRRPLEQPCVALLNDRFGPHHDGVVDDDHQLSRIGAVHRIGRDAVLGDGDGRRRIQSVGVGELQQQHQLGHSDGVGELCR